MTAPARMDGVSDAVGLTDVRVPDRIRRAEPPASIRAAEAERRELVAMAQRIEVQLREHGRNVGDFDAWRTNAKRKLTRVHGRLRWLKAWIKEANRSANEAAAAERARVKEANREAAIEAALMAAGEDLDDPVILVARLRALVCQLIRERRVPDAEWPGVVEVLNASTNYVQMMAAERVECRQ